MTLYQHVVGIDISKHTLDIALVQHEQRRSLQLANNDEGFAQLIQWLSQHQARAEETIICMENTGLYDDRLLEAMTIVGYRCALEKTTALKKVPPEHHRKDDRFDAALLAEYARRFEDKLTLWRAPKPVIEEIRLLYGERRRLITQRAAVVQLQGEASYRSADTRFAESLWQEQRRFYDAQIQRIEKKLDGLVRSDKDLFDRYKLMRSLPGFGPVASLLWTMLFYGEGPLKARQIASRFGFAPHRAASGTSQRRPARSSGHGNSEMRKVLTLCVRSAGHHDAKMRAYKQKKLSEGKASKLVTNNMINKLIGMAVAIWNQGVAYEAGHVSRFAQKPVLNT